MGDTLAGGRFEVTRTSAGMPVIAEDRETGACVEVVEGETDLRHRVVLEEMRARVLALEDPRLVAVPCTRPVCVPFESPDPAPVRTPEHLAARALELLELVGQTRGVGIEVDPERAWLSEDGLRLPAPAPALYWRRWALDGVEPSDSVGGVWRWYRKRRLELDRGTKPALSSPFETAPELARHFTDLSGSQHVGTGVEALSGWRRTVPPEPSIDRVIELGEAAFRDVGRSEDAYDHEPPPVDFILAAAYHHRACVAWSHGRVEAARLDCARACEVDPYPRYLTTAALLAEAPEADHYHDRAVAVLAGKVLEPDPLEPNLRVRVDREDAARSLYARGVHRLRTGRHQDGIADLRDSLSIHPDERVEAALTRWQTDGQRATRTLGGDSAMRVYGTSGFRVVVFRHSGKLWVRVERPSGTPSTHWSSRGSEDTSWLPDVIDDLTSASRSDSADAMDAVEVWPAGWEWWGFGTPVEISDYARCELQSDIEESISSGGETLR